MAGNPFFIFNASQISGLDRPIEAYLVFSHSSGVPGGSGVRYLRWGQNVLSSQSGSSLPRPLDLTGLTLTVGTPSANVYTLEVLTDPAGKVGGPFVLATLPFPAASVTQNITFPLGANPVPLGTEVGARVVRTFGAGGGLGVMLAMAEFRGAL
jgi:hypothetical protein